MRGLLSVFMLLTALIVVTCNYVPPLSRPRPWNQPGFPTFPGGTPPFNPRPLPFPTGTGPFIPMPNPGHPRFRRSPQDDKNKVTAHGQKEGGKSSYNVEYERKIYENKHGSVNVNAGVNKNPYSKPQTHVGVGGSFSW